MVVRQRDGKPVKMAHSPGVAAGSWEPSELKNINWEAFAPPFSSSPLTTWYDILADRTPPTPVIPPAPDIPEDDGECPDLSKLQQALEQPAQVSAVEIVVDSQPEPQSDVQPQETAKSEVCYYYKPVESSDSLYDESRASEVSETAESVLSVWDDGESKALVFLRGGRVKISGLIYRPASSSWFYITEAIASQYPGWMSVSLRPR